MYPSRKQATLRKFFSGITEQSFQTQVGVADPPLVDYITDLLLRFIRMESVFQLRNAEGKRLHEVAELMHEAQTRTGEARRMVYRHIGDFTLFWAGVYPEALGRLQGRNTKDCLLDYCNQGKRSYLLASSISSESNAEENAVLERLSYEFELCVHGLGAVRKEWERRDSEEAPRGPWLIN